VTVIAVLVMSCSVVSARACVCVCVCVCVCACVRACGRVVGGGWVGVGLLRVIRGIDLGLVIAVVRSLTLAIVLGRMLSQGRSKREKGGGHRRMNQASKSRC
jgi:hypothetical protein